MAFMQTRDQVRQLSEHIRISLEDLKWPLFKADVSHHKQKLPVSEVLEPKSLLLPQVKTFNIFQIKYLTMY